MATTLPPLGQVQAQAGTANTTQPDLTGLTGAERQLAIERAAGMKSFRRPAEGVPTAQTVPSTEPIKPKSTSESILTNANKKLEEKRTEMLSADKNFDTQLLLQKGALVTALLGKNLTPEDLRWLSPNAQRAIRENDKAGIEAYLGGVQAIFEERRNQQEMEEKKKAAEDARIEAKNQALQDKFTLLAKNNLLGSLSAEDTAMFEEGLGISPGSLKILADDMDDGEMEYQLVDGPNGSKYMVGINATTGKTTPPITVIAGKTPAGEGGGFTTSPGFSSVTVEMDAREEAAALKDLMRTDPSVTPEFALGQLKTQFGKSATDEALKFILGMEDTSIMGSYSDVLYGNKTKDSGPNVGQTAPRTNRFSRSSGSTQTPLINVDDLILPGEFPLFDFDFFD